MNDLLASQIKDNCKLALPEGLSELMSDISREVLRHQPRNLYKFITDYLSALLVTRENLCIAANVCTNVHDCGCQPELEKELEDIGLSEEDVKTAKEIIIKYFEKGAVNEGNLIQQLLTKTSMDPDMIPAIQEAIRVAFVRHQRYYTTIFESTSGSGDDQDETKTAAKHSLGLYKKTIHTSETAHAMATRIQAAYRAFGVRRRCRAKGLSPKYENLTEKSVTYEKEMNTDNSSKTSSKSSQSLPSDQSSWLDEDIAVSSFLHKKRVNTISSTCIAGSFVTLPEEKPYTVHNLEDIPEREFTNLDYTEDNLIDNFMAVEEKELLRRRINSKLGLEVEDDIDSRDYFGLEDTVRSSMDVSAQSSRDATTHSSMASTSVVRFNLVGVENEENYDGDTEA